MSGLANEPRSGVLCMYAQCKQGWIRNYLTVSEAVVTGSNGSRFYCTAACHSIPGGLLTPITRLPEERILKVAGKSKSENSGLEIRIRTIG